MVILVMGCSTMAATASIGNQTNTTTQDDVPGQKWTLVQEINGVQVSLSIATIDNERFLSIQFENTTSQTVDLICSVSKDDAAIQITPDEMTEARIQLNPNANQVIDGTYMIYLSEEDQISDFTISLKENKR